MGLHLGERVKENCTQSDLVSLIDYLFSHIFYCCHFLSFDELVVFLGPGCGLDLVFYFA